MKSKGATIWLESIEPSGELGFDERNPVLGAAPVEGEESVLFASDGEKMLDTLIAQNRLDMLHDLQVVSDALSLPERVSQISVEIGAVLPFRGVGPSGAVVQLVAVRDEQLAESVHNIER
jgi:hypothetical protein